MKKINVAAEAVLNQMLEKYQYNGHNRSNSWEFCHETFKKYSEKKHLSEEDYDFLAVHLAFYLASWGMYRASSFLLRLDYRIHIDAIRIMMSKDYLNLFNANLYEENEKEYIKMLFGNGNAVGVYAELNNYYKVIRDEINKHRKRKHYEDEASETLITKILLGVYGCVPAYDRYFKDGIGLFGGQKHLNSSGKAIWQNNSKGLLYILNKTELGNEIKNGNIVSTYANYPFMKKVDMYFYLLGQSIEELADEYQENGYSKKEAIKKSKDEHYNAISKNYFKSEK